MGNMSSFDSIIDVLNTTNQGLSTFSDADFETAFVNTLKFRQLSSHERGQITTNV